ncbi:MAG: hypothetical protein HQ500_01760 [Flavobacteriales bacterium]|nr:hypothetical protein [Flavobacteriales bacterium]
MSTIYQRLQSYAYGITFTLSVLMYHGAQIVLWMTQLPASNEDGLKNYFTLAYHVAFDANPFWFEGMNYPYGEHLVFTDGQPLVGMALWFLDIFLPIADWLPWLLPLLLIASFYWGGLLLFRILSGEGGTLWFSALLATGIMLLSPQWFRLGGHYSLAHGIVIPLVIYSLWKWTKGYWSYRPLMVLIFLSGFIHPYFAAMTAGLAFCFLIVQQMINGAALNRKTWATTLAIPLSPLLLFQALLWLTDPVTDRPENPYGYLIYRATWRSILAPANEHYASSMWWLESIGEPAVEGSFYIGLLGLTGAIIALISGLIYVRKTKLSFPNMLFLGAIPILLLALGWPFVWPYFDHLLEVAGPLRQFRGIGRFAWVFFYAANLSAALLLVRLWRRTLRWKALAVIGLSLLFFEAWMNREPLKLSTSGGSSVFSQPTQLSIDATAFDAILPLPYFHIGSEQCRTLHPSGIVESSFDLSMETGLPLLSVQMSRTSLSQTLNSLALTRHLMEMPEIATLHSEDRWLVLYDESQILPPFQMQLIGRSTPVGMFGNKQLLALDASVIEDVLKANVESALYLRSQAEKIKSDVVTFDDAGYAFDAFEGGDQTGKRFRRNDWTPLLKKDLALRSAAAHELTFWIKANQPGAMNTQLWFWERNGKEEVHFGVTEVGDHAIGFLNGWALCKVDLLPSSEGNTFELLLHRDGENLDLWIDEVLLRRLDVHLYREGDRLNINNRYYELPDSSGVQP